MSYRITKNSGKEGWRALPLSLGLLPHAGVYMHTGATGRVQRFIHACLLIFVIFSLFWRRRISLKYYITNLSLGLSSPSLRVLCLTQGDQILQENKLPTIWHPPLLTLLLHTVIIWETSGKPFKYCDVYCILKYPQS